MRLFAIRSTQISLIENYEHEISLDRYRSTDKYFKILLEDGDEKSEKDSIQTILNLQKEVKPYLERDSAISYRKSIDEKLKDLKSLL